MTPKKNTIKQPVNPFIGKRIKQAREAKKLNQTALAKQANIGRSALVHYENGNAMPGGTEILKLCNVLELSPNKLLLGSEEPTLDDPIADALDTDNYNQAAAIIGVLFSYLEKDVRQDISTLIHTIVKHRLNEDEYKELSETLKMVTNVLVPHMEQNKEQLLEQITPDELKD